MGDLRPSFFASGVPEYPGVAMTHIIRKTCGQMSLTIDLGKRFSKDQAAHML